MSTLELFSTQATAVAELHRHAITVCALLAGFAMASAYAAHGNRPLAHPAERLSIGCLYISAMAFMAVVCVSAIYLTAFSLYRQFIHVNPDQTLLGEWVLTTLSRINLFTGVVGMVALLVAMGSAGYLKDVQHGFFTAFFAALTFIVMVVSVTIFFVSPLGTPFLPYILP